MVEVAVCTRVLSALCCAVEVLGTNETLENYSCHFIFVEFCSVVGKPPGCVFYIHLFISFFVLTRLVGDVFPYPSNGKTSFSFSSTYVYLCVSSSECGMTYNVVWSNECSC